jgi:hypothetical protein
MGFFKYSHNIQALKSSFIFPGTNSEKAKLFSYFAKIMEKCKNRYFTPWYSMEILRLRPQKGVSNMAQGKRRKNAQREEGEVNETRYLSGEGG